MKRIKVFVLILVLFLTFTARTFAVELLINEFLPNPSSGSPEWVEFYNSTGTTIDLSDYYFDDDVSFDSDSGSSSKIALSGLLPSFGTCFWEFSSYLNNNGDSPTLFKIGSSAFVDSYSYSSSSAGFSYTRVPDGGNWIAFQQPTKSPNNCLDLAPTLTPTPFPTNSPTPTSMPTSTPKPSQTPIPTKILTPTIKLSATLMVNEKDSLVSSSSEEILGTESSSLTSSISAEPTKETIRTLGSVQNNLPIILFGIGSGFFILCGILTFRKLKKDKIESS